MCSFSRVICFKVLIQFGSASPHTRAPFTAELGDISHYSGPLDYSIVQLRRPQEQLTSRVFPCLLNHHGYQQAVQRRSQVAVVARSRAQTSKRTKLAVLKAQVVTQPCVDDMLCLKLTDQRYNVTVHERRDVPVFVKVGASRWALAGFGDVKRYGNVLSQPLHEIVNWAYRYIR